MSVNLKKIEMADLFNKLPGMLYRAKCDENWTMEFVSDGCKSLTGYESQDVLLNKSISFADIIHHDDFDWTSKVVFNALDEKKYFNFEYKIITKDGKLKWVWEQGFGVYDNEGKVECVEGFITDITEQRIQNDNLKSELLKKDRELLINHSLVNEYKKAVDESSIVTKTTKDGIIIFVNDEFCRISGYSREEVLGKSHNIVRHPQNPNSLFINLWETIIDKKIWKGVIKNRTKSKKTIMLKLR